MAQTLWKITAVKGFGKLAKGMNVEIVSISEPNGKTIAKEIESKYGITNVCQDKTYYEIVKL